MTMSVMGRPRRLSRDQIDAVLEWHRTRRTLKQVARDLGVSTTTLQNLIQSQGRHYKQVPPEERTRVLRERRDRRAQLSRAGDL